MLFQHNSDQENHTNGCKQEHFAKCYLDTVGIKVFPNNVAGIRSWFCYAALAKNCDLVFHFNDNLGSLRALESHISAHRNSKLSDVFVDFDGDEFVDPLELQLVVVLQGVASLLEQKEQLLVFVGEVDHRHFKHLIVRIEVS
jgi:hypothetical protein